MQKKACIYAQIRIPYPGAEKILQQSRSRIPIFFAYLETLNEHLPFEQGSNRPETSPKRVSDNSRTFISRRRKNFVRNVFGLGGTFHFYQVFEELRQKGPRQTIPRKILL